MEYNIVRHIFNINVGFFSVISYCNLVQFSDEALGEAFCRALLNFYEADCGLREIVLERPFKTFLPARAQKTLKKQARKVIQTVMMK